MKRCVRCGESKPLDEFHRDAQKADGRRPYCRTCVAIEQAERREDTKAAGVYATPERKDCPCCGFERRASEFHADRGRADGLAGHCRHCVTRRKRERVLANS